MQFEGACHRAEQILNGTFPTDNLDEYTRILLEALQYVSQPDFVQAKLSPKEYEGKVKVWNERTSTSPMSNMHV